MRSHRYAQKAQPPAKCTRCESFIGPSFCAFFGKDATEETASECSKKKIEIAKKRKAVRR